MGFEVLFKEVVLLLLFDWSQRVDFSAKHLSIWDEFNGVVPFLLIQQFIKGLFSKDVSKLLVGFRHYVLEKCWMSLSCHLSKLLGYCLSSLGVLMLTNEAYEQPIPLVHILRVGMCEAWWQPSLLGFWLLLWDFLYVHLLA